MSATETDRPAREPAPAARPQGAVHKPLEGRARLFGTIALSTAVFMNVLDSSIANVSIPTIAGDLGVSATQGTWVITSFAVANAITVPLTGWLTQRFGQVRLFVLSVLLFVLSSWLCGFSWSLESLVAFRVLQGAVAGPMIPLSQSLMLGSYPKEKAGMALAMWSMTVLVGPVVGPLLGGWISDNYTWPWIFYINVPVGLLAGWASWQLYKTRDSVRSKLPIDTTGLALLVLWVGALQLMLDKGKELDWFASPAITTMAVVAVVSF
ncbi:MAG: DHA2 family efflux MFS transporter permease subunit, partial [Pollutimonas bauzanensis]